MATILSSKEEAIADFYASGVGVQAIALRVGCCRATVYNALRRPLVKARVMETRAAALRPLYERFRVAVNRAEEVVREILENPDAAHRDRLNAAKTIIETALSLYKVACESADMAGMQAQIAQRLGDDEIELEPQGVE